MGDSLVEKMVASLGIESNTAIIIISIAIILFFGFLATRLTKLLKLPNVTAYILTGILLVPIWSLIPGSGISGIIPQNVISGMDFLSDIALAFIAFSAGEFFRLDILKKSGAKVLVITLLEAFMAVIIVFMLCYFALGIPLHFSLVLAALSSATAPASTIMTIKQTKAKGEYVNTLLEVVALDDVVSLVLYTIAISLCLAMNPGGAGVSFSTIGMPILKNIICLLIGLGFGFVLKLMLPEKRTTDNRLIIVIAMLFLFCGICALMDQSPLLGCMGMGMVYINITNDSKLFKQLNYFSPSIFLCFFVMSGMKFNLRAFTNMTKIGYAPLFLVAIVYFIARILGKYFGAYLGGVSTKSSKEIRNYLGLGLVPQAGVAIGLAYMGARILGNGEGELGDLLQTIILASSVLYELVGPGLSKLGLYLSKSYSNDIDEVIPASTVTKPEEQVSDLEVLIRQIKEIEKTIPDIVINEEEDAFTEAADEYVQNLYARNRRGFINRR